MSHKIENDITETCGVIIDCWVERINNAKWFSVLADKTSGTSGTEYGSFLSVLGTQTRTVTTNL